MSYTIITGPWSQLGQEATAIRHEVFVVEQQVPVELELDEHDSIAIHAVAFEGDKAIGTARLLPDFHLGRMAVLRPHRGSGVGSMILNALIELARRRGDAYLLLASQCKAQAFYGSLGFVSEGDIFMDAGIEHVMMRKLL